MSWILDWFSSNWSEIVAFLTSGTFVSSLFVIWNTIRSRKNINDNTMSNKSLLNALNVVNSTKDSIDDGNKRSENLIERVNALEASVTENNKRLDALLDMCTFVYSRSKDEDVRNQVSLISNTVKYENAATVNELRSEIDKLKKELNSKNNVDKCVDEPKSVDTPVDNVVVEDEILRG